jgi:hypothetical protein
LYSEIFLNSLIFTDLFSTENGGALSITNLIIIKILNCSFSNSIAQLNGGAILLNNLNSDYIILNLEISNFYNLSATNGGALYLQNILN